MQTLVVTVLNSSLLDFETSTSHTITVRATDQGSLTFDKAFTISLTNVNEAPTVLAPIGATNLISNGSFETGPQAGVPTGWTFSGAGGLESSSPGRASAGTSFFALGGWSSSSGGVLSQNITTVAGTTYNLIFDTGSSGPGSVPQVLNVQALNGASQLLNQTITDTTQSGNWTAQSMQR